MPVDVMIYEGEEDQVYIGDGVYASNDGYQIWLRTLEGNAIALEPSVMRALIQYWNKLSDREERADVHEGD